MDFVSTSATAILIGFALCAAFLSILAHLHYRDPTLLAYSQYTGIILISEIFTISLQSPSTTAPPDIPRFGGIVITAAIVYFQQALILKMLNLAYYSARMFRAYLLMRIMVIAGFLVLAGLQFMTTPPNIRRIDTFVIGLLDTASHLSSFIAVLICMRAGHEGTGLLRLWIGIWIIGNFAILYGFPAEPMTFHRSLPYRILGFSESIILGIALLARLSTQYKANQRIMSDLIVSESLASDYRRKYISLQEQLRKVLTENFEQPMKGLLGLLQKLRATKFNASQAATTAEALKALRKLMENTKILLSTPADNLHGFSVAHSTLQAPPREKIGDTPPVVTGTVIIYAPQTKEDLPDRLGSLGFETVTATSKENILTLISALTHIHMVLVSCTDEAEVREACKLCSRIRDIKGRTQLAFVVILPVLHEPGQITRLFHCGASDVLSPFLTGDEFDARIQVHVENCRLALELDAWHLDLESRIRLNTEQLRLQGRMNPHFLFNSLTTIYSLLDSDKVSAQKAILLLADIYRFYLDFSYESMVFLSNEWEFVHNYLDLTRIRYGNSLTVIMARNVPNAEKCQLPPLSLQPLVENAVKHGLRGREKDGRIEVSCKIIRDGAQIVVKDNGPGIQKVDESRSLGNIKKRLSFHYRQVDLQLSVLPQGGTSCTLRFFGRRNHTRTAAVRPSGQNILARIS